MLSVPRAMADDRTAPPSTPCRRRRAIPARGLAGVVRRAPSPGTHLRRPHRVKTLAGRCPARQGCALASPPPGPARPGTTVDGTARAIGWQSGSRRGRARVVDAADAAGDEADIAT